MQTLTEKRVFGSKFGTTELFVASETGLVGVTVSADQIGEFGLAAREPIHAVAVDDRGVLIGTDEDVLYSDGERTDDRTAQSRSFEALTAAPFGQARNVGWGPAGPIVADDTGAVFERSAWSSNETESEWSTLGDTGGVRAIDGGLIAATDGVYQLTDGAISHVGLSDGRDVAGHGTPLAATADGLFALGNGWLPVQDGSFEAVASDGHGHAHAVGPDGLVRHSDGNLTASDGWGTDELPVGSPVVDVAYGSGIVAAITENGTLCVDAGDGWRHQLLGVRGVSELAVGPGQRVE